MEEQPQYTTRRQFLATGAASAIAVAALSHNSMEEAQAEGRVNVAPPTGKRILFATKLSMIAKEDEGKALNLADRLRLATKAGFDGVDFDEAGDFTVEQAQSAAKESGVFIHNAINHAHWSQRLTSPKEEERAKGLSNLEHCIKVSHATGGSGVLLVIGHANDGPAEVVEERARQEMKKALPLAAALGQAILIENVWNSMFYKHDSPPEQTPEAFIKFVDSFNSPWVGMYYDIGNHWKYGQPGEWIHAFGRRCFKLDVKGFSRAKNKFVDITDAEDDVPWKQVQKALADIEYTGWATAEVGGGGLKRLTQVHENMKKAFGV